MTCCIVKGYASVHPLYSFLFFPGPHRAPRSGQGAAAIGGADDAAAEGTEQMLL